MNQAYNFSAYNGERNYAFASYSHKDSGAVYPILEQLWRSGINIWYDEGIPLLVDYGGELYSRIQKCTVFLLFASRNSVSSPNVDKEAQNAFSMGKTVVVVNLDGTPVPQSWQYHTQLGDGSISVYGASPAVYIPAICGRLSQCTESAKISRKSKASKAKPSSGNRFGRYFRSALFIILLGVIAGFAAVTLTGRNKLLENMLPASEDDQLISLSEEKTALAECHTGDTVVFGGYEQDGVSENGREPMEWIVLAEDDDSILLMSKAIVEAMDYNDSFCETCWRDCSLRSWLNGDFCDEAFSEQEQAMIKAVSLENPNVEVYHESVYSDEFLTDSGLTMTYMGEQYAELTDGSFEQTSDRVFCLGYDEFAAYWEEFYGRDETDLSFLPKPTDSCKKSADGGITSWWLRSPAENSYTVYQVRIDAYIPTDYNIRSDFAAAPTAEQLKDYRINVVHEIDEESYDEWFDEYYGDTEFDPGEKTGVCPVIYIAKDSLSQ